MSVLQAAGPPEGVVGVAGRALGSGLDAEGGAQRLTAGADSTGGQAQLPEGNQLEPGPQQRPPHQPVPGIKQTHAHRNAATHLQIRTAVLYSSYRLTTYMK